MESVREIEIPRDFWEIVETCHYVTTPTNPLFLSRFSIGSLIARNFATKFNDRLQSLTLLGSIYKRSEKQQKTVNERFNQAKKELKLSKQALKRWFTDKYLENNPDTYEKISAILASNNMAHFLKVYELFGISEIDYIPEAPK